MKTGIKLLISGIAVSFVLQSACLASPITYKLDNGAATNEIVGDQPGDQAFINVFATNPSDAVITQLSVAWAGLPAGANVRLVLYSVDDSAASPIPAGVAPTFLHVLQVVSAQVTAGQRNDDSGQYPPGGEYGAVWTTYNITPTTITTGRFAVGAIAYEDNATFGCVWQDGTVLPVMNDVLIATAVDSSQNGLAMNSDLSNIVNGNDTVNLRTFDPGSGAGAWDYPYLIEATAVPEPATLCVLALGGLAMLRRRK